MLSEPATLVPPDDFVNVEQRPLSRSSHRNVACRRGEAAYTRTAVTTALQPGLFGDDPAGIDGLSCRSAFYAGERIAGSLLGPAPPSLMSRVRL